MSWLGFIVSMIFMTLKLTDHIDWSWWLVWLPVSIAAAFDLILGLSVLYIAKKRYNEAMKEVEEVLKEMR